MSEFVQVIIAAVLGPTVVAVVAWWLTGRQTRALAEAQDRRAALLERYEAQKRTLEDVQRVLTAATARRRPGEASAWGDVAVLRVRVLLSFGNEQMANNISAALNGIMEHYDPEDRSDWDLLKTSNAWMIDSIRQLETELRLPITRLTPRTADLVRGTDRSLVPKSASTKVDTPRTTEARAAHVAKELAKRELP